jgi:hypothetical protein
MAVGHDAGTPTAAGRRLKVGANVLVSIVLMLGIAGLVQYFGFAYSTRWSLSSSGLSTLSEPTEKLLRGLDSNIRITSLYFETDREDEDQGRFRQTAWDLLGLYQAANRSNVDVEWINPLKDVEKYNARLREITELPRFAAAVQAHRELIEHFEKELAPDISALLKAELDLTAELGGVGISGETSPIAQVEAFLNEYSTVLGRLTAGIQANQEESPPAYGAAVQNIKTAYRTFLDMFDKLGRFAAAQLSGPSELPEPQAKFLREAAGRYYALSNKLREAQTQADALPALPYERVLEGLDTLSNAILITTDQDAVVVDFADVWAAIMPGGPQAATRFQSLAFKGEEALTSAILRATHQAQTAVVFVRYGGPALFFGGFAPNQPPAMMRQMKERLEDANFIVSEWDVQTQKTMPAFDPEPTRIIYVVRRPIPPPPGPFGQPPQEPPFSDADQKLVLDAIQSSGRALFMAGWVPGQQAGEMLLPDVYKFNEHLDENWGVKIDTGTLLLFARSIAPGKYFFGGDQIVMHEGTQVATSDHVIVSTPTARRLFLPMCAPIIMAQAPPTGVTITPLVTQPALDGIWGAQNVLKYQEQSRGEFVTKVEGDLEGPFTLAVAGEKDGAKMVLIGSDDFATDAIAAAAYHVLDAQGIAARPRYPGNMLLVVNALHWLNDDEAAMNIGTPIEQKVLEIPDESTRQVVKAVTVFAWPAAALLAGGVAWWIRRR